MEIIQLHRFNALTKRQERRQRHKLQQRSNFQMAVLKIKNQ